MAPVDFDVLLGHGHPKGDDEDDAPASSSDMGDEDDFDDLSSAEIVEHKHAAAQELADAVKKGATPDIVKAFETLYGLCQAADEHEPEKSSPDMGGDEDDEGA